MEKSLTKTSEVHIFKDEEYLCKGNRETKHL